MDDDYWVAVGKGTNTIAHSVDGLEWIGLGETIFSVQGLGVSFNGTKIVAVGQGTNSIAYCELTDIYEWSGLGATIFSIKGIQVAYNGI